MNTHDKHFNRRDWLALAGGGALSALAPRGALAEPARTAQRPFRIYAVTFRGMTDVEKGFAEYFASRKIPVQISYRDMNREPQRMPGFLEEIRATRPDLIYFLYNCSLQ